MVLLKDSTQMIQRRVLYIGSATPMETATGLEAVQGPLLERYPMNKESSMEGYDTWLSVSNSEITMQYVDDSESMVQFPISSLTMCAAVRCVNTINAATSESIPRFVSLNDPLAGGSNSERPAIYTMITRRTQGRRLLECHGFICSSARDAMELVKCTQQAGENYKRNGTLRSKPVVQNIRPESGMSNGSFKATDFNQTSTLSRTVINGVPNGMPSEPPTMRLIPGEPIQQTIKAGPEFFEPVSKQGYFYSSNQAEVKRFNVKKVAKEEDKENVEERYVERVPVQTPRMANGYGPTVIRVGAAPPPPPPQIQHRFIERPPPMRYFAPPPMPRPMFYGPPPPPMPPPPMFRPRFFSPPPPRMRPMPYMMPPPEPIFAPPLYVHRNRSGSRSSSEDSRSKSPKNRYDENTIPKVPNGDADTSSDGTIGRRRPNTPPTDYVKKQSGHRMSRRDQYEYRSRLDSPPRNAPYEEMPPPFAYDYYVYPPRHGGYEPFTMYNPHARSRSMPPRGRSKSPHKKGKKKHKKGKKKHRKLPQRAYEPRQYAHRIPDDHHKSDVSTDSHAGYQSEIQTRPRPAVENDSGYQFYPPRDFRKNERQFMNERNFSKSIIEETRRSRDSKSYPTAYEMNEKLAKSSRNDDVDFTMY